MADASFELDLSLQVGKYDIRKLLGKGATGTVYLAVDTFTGGEVALKVIEPEVFRDPKFGAVYRTQFLNEASLAGKLRHPHIVAILNAVVQEDSGHMAMECVMGGDLSQHATPDTLLPVADVLQMIFKCCGALDYAFREGIIHRDIKPANIMIAQGTDVKIADFGAALLRKAQAGQTAPTGSPPHPTPSDQLAPRSAQGDRPRRAAGAGQEARAALRDLGRIRGRALEPDEARAAARCDSRQRKIRRAQARGHALHTVRRRNLGAGGRRSLDPRRRQAADHPRKRPREEFLLPGAWTGEGHPARTPAQHHRRARVLRRDGLYPGRRRPPQGRVESVTDVLLADFEPEPLARMSIGAQYCLMRALVRNLVDRLELANTRLVR